MKIKLRDMTFEQYEEWRVKKCVVCESCIFKNVKCHRLYDNVWVKHKDLYSDKFLDQEIEIDEPILTDEEREYLRAVIKPFRSRTSWVIKTNLKTDENLEYLYVHIREVDTRSDAINGFGFPFFEKGTMYKGMEANKKYTLEELEL